MKTTKCSFKVEWLVETIITAYGESYKECKYKAKSEAECAKHAIEQFTVYPTTIKSIKLLKSHE